MILPKIKASHVAALLYKVGITDKHGKKQRVQLKFNDNRICWNSFFINSTERSIALQFGQDQDFSLKLEGDASLHMHVYSKKGYMLCHIDNYDPNNNPIGHLLGDTNAKNGIIPGVAFGLLHASSGWGVISWIAGTIGAATLDTKFSKNIFAFGQFNQSTRGWKIIQLSVNRRKRQRR